MKKQSKGFALILFGILLCAADSGLNQWLTRSYPIAWAVVGLLLGVIGLVFVFTSTDDKREK